ncbi:hypothetical protein F4677DRAFT_411152 [Hypoxylon crocopeplum]|nr:hypothetical protein F4677DRAFT_411152 [Hypoxylon crocopeplum]
MVVVLCPALPFLSFMADRCHGRVTPKTCFVCHCRATRIQIVRLEEIQPFLTKYGTPGTYEDLSGLAVHDFGNSLIGSEGV